MDYFLIIIGSVLMIAGLVGCALPVLPGPPLSFVGLLLLHFTAKHQFSGSFLLSWALIAALDTLIDYVVPAWAARKAGASRFGVWGSVIGLFFGLIFFPPFGMIIGTFSGAIIGELIAGKKSGLALKSGFGSFIGFLSVMLLKITASGMMTWYFLKTLIF